MKGLLLQWGTLGILLTVVWGYEDSVVASSDMIEEMLEEMPQMIKASDMYSERFYPEMIRTMNKKLYHRKSRPQPMPEKRMRNIKLNRYLTIPNDRYDGMKYSSFPILATNDSYSTNFVFFRVKDAKEAYQIIDIHSKDTACIFGMSEEKTAVKAKACREDVPNMIWELLPNKYGDYWVRQRGTDLCLAPVLTMGQPIIVQLLKCDRWNPFLIWDVHDAYLYFK